MDFFPTMIFLLVFLPIVALFASMPYLTRRTISFGVSITEDNFHHLKLITMRKRYVLWSCCSGFLLTVLSLQTERIFRTIERRRYLRSAISKYEILLTFYHNKVTYST